MFRIIPGIILFLSMGCFHLAAGNTGDLAVLQKQIIEEILKPMPDSATVQELMQTMKDDGCWEDIDYTNKRRANWPVTRHLSQVTAMAKAWHGPHALAGDNTLKMKVLAGLDFWLKHDLQNPNWFPNQITVPRELASILLLLGDEVDLARFDKALEIIKRAQIRGTGQNRVWLTDVCVMRGCLQEDEQLVRQAIKAIAETFVVSEGEGLQADMSFWQHGPCFYSGGYGKPFAEYGAKWAVITRNTPYAFSEETIKLISSYILDGQQWVLRGMCFDPTAQGRGITNSDRQADASVLAQPCRNMARLKTPREAEFINMARWVTEEDKVYHGPIGNRHFWRSDIMAHQRPGYYASAKMYSTRVVNTDSLINGEGVLSHYIADGSSFLMRTGREYYAIYGVWNWRRPPGITVELKGFEGQPRREGNRDFVGGVSDGMYGAAAFDFVRDDLTARKAWFFFDDEVVCLGAGIHCSGSHQVITSLNQCWLNGEVLAAKDGKIETLSRSLHGSSAYDWIWHNGIGYLILGDSSLTIRNNRQTGSWYAINTNESKKKVSGDVFSVWIDHGVKPVNAQYAYLACPDMAAEKIVDYAAKLPVRILANTSAQQIIRHELLGITAAVCYEAGKVDCGGFTVDVKTPCLLLVRTYPEKMKLAVSDPTARLSELLFTVNKPIKGDGVDEMKARHLSRVTIKLPQKLYAGQSVVKEYAFCTP